MPAAGLAGVVGSAIAVVAPIAGVGRIAVATIAISRSSGIADEVVTRQNAPCQIRMRSDTRIDHGDGHRSTADLQVPRRRGIHATDRIRQRPLQRIAGIVGHSLDRCALHCIDILKRRIALELRRNAYQLRCGNRVGQRQHPYVPDLVIHGERHTDQLLPSGQERTPVRSCVAGETHHQLATCWSADRDFHCFCARRNRPLEPFSPKDAAIGAQLKQHRGDLLVVQRLREAQFERARSGRSTQSEIFADQSFQR